MNNVTLSGQIRKLRTAKKMTLAVLAERLGVTTSTVAAYENGSRNPSFDVLITIARIFNVTVDNLLGYTNKDYIDVSELSLTQRDNVQSLITTYRKFNALIVEMFDIEGTEEELCWAAEEYFSGSVDSLRKLIENKKFVPESKTPTEEKISKKT